MNMRFWFDALAEPNRMAAQVFTTNPMKVSTLGLMRESASQRTMVSSRTPQARPKALVQLALIYTPRGTHQKSARKSPLLAQKTREKWGTRVLDDRRTFTRRPPWERRRRVRREWC